MRSWLAPPLLGLLALGCSGSLISGRDDSATTVEELKKRVLELQKQTTVHELEIERLQERLAELEKRKAPMEVPPPRQRNIPVETVEPPSIEESDLEAVSLGKPSPPPPRQTAPPSPPPPPVEAPRPTVEAPPAAPHPVSAEEQKLYDRGYTLYHQGRYLDSEAELHRFLREYPSSALADNAQYWIGECRYARKDTQGALAAFRETVERYPTGNKVPDALLKAGQCFETLGDRSAALETYREVVERYPTSAAAARAEERLGTMK